MAWCTQAKTHSQQCQKSACDKHHKSRQLVLREHLLPSFRGNHATQHGKDSEPKALKELAELGHPIVKMGTILSASEPWLSASPDGMIDKDDKVLVEVKCPLVTSDSLTDMLEAG